MLRRLAFFVEFDRLFQQHPNRWSLATLRAVATLADTLDPRRLEETLDNFESAIRELRRPRLN